MHQPYALRARKQRMETRRELLSLYRVLIQHTPLAHHHITYTRYSSSRIQFFPINTRNRRLI
jgi:hypothetical protein